MVAGAAMVVAVDQLTKWWALEALTEPRRVIELFWTLRLRVVYNTGTAFSLTSDSGPFVTVVAVAVVGYLIWSGRSNPTRGLLACYALIIGGTVGNLVDRLFRDGDGALGGPVIDFVDAQWFPVFNGADAALVIGIALLVLVTARTPEPDEGASRQAAS